MEQKTLWITIVLFVIACGAALAFQFSEKEEVESVANFKTIDAEEYAECDKEFGTEKEEECYLNAARNSKDTSICMNVETNWKKQKCLVEVATYLKDPVVYSSVCEQTTARTADRDICYQNYARDSKDVSICSEVSIYDTDSGTNPRDYCYYYVALETGNAANCEPIHTLILRDQCLREVN